MAFGPKEACDVEEATQAGRDRVQAAPRREGTKGQAEERRAEHGSQRGPLDAPFGDERGRDVADRGGVEAVQQHDAEAQGEDGPLVGGERVRVQKRLDIKRAAVSYGLPPS